MKILFVSNLYPPHHLGGYEMLCHEVAGRLGERRHAVTVLTSTFGVDGATEEPGVIRRLLLESDVYYYHPLQALARYRTIQRANRNTIDQVLTAVRPDAVVVWGMWQLSPNVAAHLEAAVGSRLLYYLANEWPAEAGAHESYWDGSANSLAGKVFKRLLRAPIRSALRSEWRPLHLRFEHIAACSAALRDRLVQAGVPVEHARVIYHGIDPLPYVEAARRRADLPRVGTLKSVFVGSLVPHKGVHTAIEALGLLAQSEPAIATTLDILGAGHPDYEQRLHQLVASWNVGDRVTFHPPIPRAELPGFLARFDALLLPSTWAEPQARISQEALAAGLALVATPTGGTREILIDGENGLAFQPEDASALMAHLQRLAHDVDLRCRLTAAGQRTVLERFTMDRMIDEIESFLRQMADNECS